MDDKYPIGSLGYWIERQEMIPEISRLDLTSMPGFKAISGFGKSDKGHRIMCEDYLIRASIALSEAKDLVLERIERKHDLHCFLHIRNSGLYLHLQVYPGTIDINASSREYSVLVSAYIKREPKDNTPNTEGSWQKKLLMGDNEELISLVENILR